MQALYKYLYTNAMKSQYPFAPITYQSSEPLNYLQNFEGIRQISVEKVKIIKAEFSKEKQGDKSSLLDKEEDDTLSSYFYNQSFTPCDED